MDIKELLELFQKANQHNHWGMYAMLCFNDDGSGDIIDTEGDNIFSFDSITELKEELDRAIRS